MSEDIQQLLRTVENGTPEDIWDAAKQLESVVTEMVSSLLSLLQSAKGTDTRAAAAYVLGFGRYASARRSLEEVLSNHDEEPFVRGHAAEALAYIQNRESVGVLLKHLEDQDPGVKYWCIFALGKLGDAKAVFALKGIIEGIGDQLYEKHSLRAEALDAIAEIKRHLR